MTVDLDLVRRTSLAVLLPCVALVLWTTGCGSSGDPYSGTWRISGEPDLGGLLVIRIESGDYRGYVLVDESSDVALVLPFVERNGTLCADGAGSNGGDVLITPGSRDDRLLLTDGAARPVELVRISPETPVPSGQPGATVYPDSQ